jgi:1-acyl-sn-glycerol-3-phosphate acyltransferase
MLTIPGGYRGREGQFQFIKDADGTINHGAIPAYTDRPDPEAMRRARAVLAAGEPLVVTPEGRISRDGRPGRARPGIIALSASLRVPIVPAAIRGAFEAFPRHRRLPRPRPVSVVFAAPLPPPVAPDRITQRALADRLMVYIAALLDGATDPPRPW